MKRVVVVSDIHLGEDLVAKGPPSLQTYINRLNEEFVAFVDWLRDDARDHTLELVVNGDMFDFVKISLRPDAREAYMRWRQGLSKTEHRIGLDNTPDRVLWKLERIFEGHRPAFVALSELIGAGHRLHIVAGNHDREFYYPEVMQALRAMLCDLYFARLRERAPDGDTAAAREAFVQRVGFSMWFHLAAPDLYIEHGHQYDPFCSFEYLLAPRKRPEDIKVALPLSHKAIPYFADLLGDMSTHNMDTTGAVQHVRRVAKLGPRMLARIFWAYLRAMTSILREAGGRARKARRLLEAEHLTERIDVAQRYGVSERDIDRLDALHATPAEFSLRKMIQVFYVDRVVLSALTLIACLGFSLMVAAPWQRALAIGSTLVLAFACSELLGRYRRFDTREALREGARGVQAILQPRVIVFGHSHKPELVRVGEQTAYINIGSWISRAALLGEAPWGMTFAWIGTERDDLHRSGLYRWVGSEKRPQLVEPLPQ